jgi:1-deoxy-D-xylulose-5-phosphate reductoisomerase
MTHADDRPTRIAVLGSTGSIGRQTLDVIRAHRDRFEVVALAAGSNADLLQQQIDEFSPSIVSASDASRLNTTVGTRVYPDADGLLAAATDDRVDVVVIATSGIASIAATLAAAELGKTLALANKEALICAADLLLPIVQRTGARIHPVDSEHSAIWQCLGTLARDDVASITLTASGGPFRTVPADGLAKVTAADALRHPTWTMGRKITIDSATLVNKGLEVIEASRLFSISINAIQVVVHPESIVHSLVTYHDGSTLAQLSHPDMRLPIQYALTWPDHWPHEHKPLDLAAIGALTFDAPDPTRFGSLEVCYQAGRQGASACVALCAADEVLVDAFLDGQIRFTDFPIVLADAVENANDATVRSLDDIAAQSEAATRRAAELIGNISCTR